MRRPKVVIADDSPTELMLMATALDAAGYEVLTATDGDAAFVTIVAELPDCAILDVVLPKHNGFQLCRHLKHTPETQHIPIVLVSVKNQPMDRQWGLQQGAALYLAKPFRAPEFVASIQHLLG